METFALILSIFQVICSVAIIIAVLFQTSKRAGLSGAISGGAETFLGKNKAHSVDAKLSAATKWLAILLAISTFALNFM
jgi:preprotein translocase subunit SecG